MNSEFMYIYQPEQDGNQKQETKTKLPTCLENFKNRHEEDTTPLDKLTTEFLDSDSSKNIRPVLHEYVKFYGVDEIDAYFLLIDIISEYERIAFRAGFQTAKELLK